MDTRELSAPDELRRLHRLALAHMSELVERITEEDLDRPTPCEGWSVRDLVEHAVGLNLGFAEAFGEGVAPESAYRPRPLDAWRDSADEVAAAVDVLLGKGRVWIAPVSRDIPFAINDAIVIHLLDVVVHGWDLAAALGVDYRPDRSTVEAVSSMAALIASRPLPSSREQFAAPLHAPEDEGEGWGHILRLLGRAPTWRGPDDDENPPSLEPVSLRERLGRFTETWSPKIVGRVNDHELKVVKMLGEFEWHTHADTDELFVVITGRTRIEMEHGSVTLGPGDMYVVPRGCRHRPVAETLTEAVLLEPAGVINTGDAGGPLTAVDEVLV